MTGNSVVQQGCGRVAASFHSRMILSFVAVGLMSFLVGCGSRAENSRQAAERDLSQAREQTQPAQQIPSNALVLEFPYGSEKEKWLEDVTKRFNDSGQTTANGRQIFVKSIPMGSGEQITEILEGRLKAHLVSPASSVFIELGNAESKARTGGPLVDKTENLVLSPVVIAMWKPMAEALGWGEKPLGWSDILEMAGEQEGWAKYGYPHWGKFKFGHTHPEYSNSGIISLFAEVYAGAGKTAGLTLDDLQKPEVAEFLGNIERSVVHYGSSTGFFGRTMFNNGPEYLSAAVLYENMVIESYNKIDELPFPVVAIYPKEGTFWSDHPVGVVERDWVTEEHREAAGKYIEFLTETAQQTKALEYGFRPADLEVALGAPLDKEHGVDPNEPQTTLEVPTADVAQAIIDLWKKHKKHTHVALLIDVSGSMKGSKMFNAKQGAKQLIDILGDEDVVSLLPFNNTAQFAAKSLKLGTNREEALKTIESFYAGGGTAMYDGVKKAHEHLSQSVEETEMIHAIVVLSDGVDTSSQITLPTLRQIVRTVGVGPEATKKSADIRLFTIGYGTPEDKSGKRQFQNPNYRDLDMSVLEDLSKSTGAKTYRGTPQNIREVFKEISTFF